MSDFAVGSTDWNLSLGTVLLGVNNLFNVDAPSSSVDSQDFTNFTSDSIFLGTNFDHNSVSLSNWKRSAVVLCSKFFAQMGAHHLSSKAAWSGEMGLSRLSSLAGNAYMIQNMVNTVNKNESVTYLCYVSSCYIS